MATAVAGPSGIQKESETKVRSNSKQTILDIVCEGIQTIEVPGKGASAQAIKKYVQSKKENESTKLGLLINKALVSGIEKGILARPKNFTYKVSGATGHFTLAKAKPESSKKTDDKQNKENSKTDSDNITKRKPLKQKTLVNDPSTSNPEIEPLKTSRTNAQSKGAVKKEPKPKKATTKKLGQKAEASDTEIAVKRKPKFTKS